MVLGASPGDLLVESPWLRGFGSLRFHGRFLSRVFLDDDPSNILFTADLSGYSVVLRGSKCQKKP